MRAYAERSIGSSVELKEAQPQVIRYLGWALEEGRLPHALLFLGPEGSLRRETAVWLAQKLFGAAFETHPDLKFFGPAEDARTIKIAQIRQLISQANLRPF